MINVVGEAISYVQEEFNVAQALFQSQCRSADVDQLKSSVWPLRIE